METRLGRHRHEAESGPRHRHPHHPRRVGAEARRARVGSLVGQEAEEKEEIREAGTAEMRGRDAVLL